MLAIMVDLLQGTYRADPDGAANTGSLTRGEWPPAPSRLLAALVAADGTGDRCRVTDGSELEWFEKLPPPDIHAHAQPWHQVLRPRYVVFHRGNAEQSTHQEYVGRRGMQVRPGVRVSPRYPRVTYAWDAEVPPSIAGALRRRAARVGYLGAADSPVRLRVRTAMRETEAAEDVFRPDSGGTLEVSVPAAGDLRILDAVYDRWVEHGAGVARAQFPALRHQVRYRSPATPAPDDAGTVAAWLRLGVPVSGRRVTPITTLFKQAVLSRHQTIHGEPPALLHGHGFKDSGYELARFLALPDVGFRRSRGRIHGLALWLPPGCDTVMRQRIRDAAFAVRRLTGRGIDVAVAPRDDEKRPRAADPRRWTRPARCWITAFPALHERRGRLDLYEVSRWCRHAGLPEPVRFRSARSPLAPGAVDLAPVEVNRPGRTGLPYSHIALWFAEPVRGPVVIGAGRQRGMGLCVPVEDGDERDG
ncbi:MAG: type I-U CRISPR-associated protein Csb2 [Deltaproteobacteria bacterium]|nr:type I-U CRISPR-associated protein Csb2 [Deltaproteobacteria bacterium]